MIKKPHKLETYNLVKGDTYVELLDFFLDESNAADITLYSNIVMEVRKGPTEDSELLKRFTIGQGITPQNSQQIRIEVPASETKLWAVGAYYRHIRLYNGVEVYTRAMGIMNVEPNLISND